MPKPTSLEALRQHRGLGQKNSRLLRMRKGEQLLWEIARHIRSLGRTGPLQLTLRELAEELNQRGVRTNRGNLLDERKVHAALQSMGINKNAILAWRRKAEDKAIEFGVPTVWMVWQLWQDWQNHLNVGLLHKGTMSVARHPFKPTYLHPSEWVAPWIRDPHSALRMMPTPAVARACYPLFMAFDPNREDVPHGDEFDEDENLEDHPVLRAARALVK